MRAHLYDAQRRMILPQGFSLDCEVSALNSIEIYGSKINALNNRAAARDLYDVYRLVKSEMFKNDMKYLRKSVIFYHVLTSDEVNGNFDLKATEKLNQHSILRELVPVLKKGEAFILKEVLHEVKSFVNELMAMTEDEKEFIESFNNGVYCPELLFDDKKILDNIKNHPMAKWKASKLESD